MSSQQPELLTHEVWTLPVVPPIDEYRPGALVCMVDSTPHALRHGIWARLAGWEVRDTIAIVEEERMQLGTVLRKPFTGTLVDNVLTHNTGVMNIQACRIGDPSSGRWPADVIYVHTAECARTGIKEVTTNSHHPASRGAGGRTASGHKGQAGLVERSPGTETVESWDCAEGCPVADLDAQSGELISGANPSRRSGHKSVAMSGEVLASDALLVRRGQDQGGASRFFACVADMDAALGWIETLLAPPQHPATDEKDDSR